MIITFENSIENYENIIREIESVDIHYAIATESDNNEISDDDKKSDSVINKIITAISEMIKIALANLETFKQKLANSFQNFMMTNDGYEKKLRIAETNTKPLNAVRLITYTYNDDILTNTLNKFKPIIDKCISTLEINSEEDLQSSINRKDLLSLSQKDMERQVMAMLGASKENSRIQIYFHELKKEFRGEKKERIIKKSEISSYRKLISNVKQINIELSNLQLYMAKKMNQIESRIKIKMKSRDISQKIKNALKQRLGNLISLYASFTAFLEVYYVMKIEQVLNARVVLKRLYQF